MAGVDGLLYNVASFVSGLFLLEYGADKFIDHTAIVARRLNVSPTLVGLLTCGAEWEELVVIAVALGQNNSALAVGNLLGSSIANILGSFSLGLVFMNRATFDRSSKIYAAVLLAVTSAFIVLLYTLDSTTKWLAGGVLIVSFVVYIVSIASLIYRGTLAAPEDDSDSDSDGESESDSEIESDSDDESDSEGDSDNIGERDYLKANRRADGDEGSSSNTGCPVVRADIAGDSDSDAKRASGLLDRENQVATSAARSDHGVKSRQLLRPSTTAAQKIRHAKLSKRRPKPLWRHVLWLIAGFAALLVSSYIIAHSANNLGTTLGLSGSIVGTTILSLATTLPEKFVAILSGVRHQPGIMVANTVGSNIFLATLCGGVLFLCGNVEEVRAAVTAFEALVMWVSAALIFAMVMGGARRWMGVACLCAYVAFLVLELTTGRGLLDD